MYRTHTCGELNIADITKEVTLAGWVQTIRNFGGLVFVDLRDRYGITQLIFKSDLWADPDKVTFGREYVLQVKGIVSERSNKNYNMLTGEIEVEVEDNNYKVLNQSATPPFTIQDETDGGDELRMKYRFLDLRRNAVKKNLELRYSVSRSTRNYLHENNFMDIETPFLIKSTPEGARDFVVPSRMNEGQFYALPQSPQTFKQLLMISGYDRYYQIVKCFRDEDLRADRQPEFTQIDCEMCFVEQEDILQMFEGLVKRIFKDVKNIDYSEIVQRMTWEEAMWTYGNDKPDTRFEMKLANLKFPQHVFSKPSSENLIGTEFPVFASAESVIAIAVPNCAEYTRKQTDELTEWVKRPQIGMRGLVYIKCNADGTFKSSVDKFYDADALKKIAEACNAKLGDLILIVAGAEEKTRKAASDLRMYMATTLGMRKADEFKLLWVLDFPLFEYAEEDNRWVARHHPFTSPRPADIETMINNNPQIENAAEYLKHPYANIKANAYDMVLNGNEIGGGSIRIFQRELQEKMFAALGMDAAEQQHKFGFLLGAFEYGAPPHGGIAFGFDRLCALLGGSESIRDFIAFPKNNSGRDVMIDAPSTIDDKQLDELNIALKNSGKD